MSERIIIDGCAIACVDPQRTEHRSGHIIIEGRRIVAVAEGRAPDDAHGALRLDGRGMLATPGLVNCHHHMFQHLTRCYAQQSNLFEWLVTLYPTWAQIDDDMQQAASRAAISSLLTSGCSLATDHHYLHPRTAGDMLAIEIDAARTLGMRFHPCRGSMDLGVSQGGLPPDAVVEDRDTIMQETAEAVDRWHDTSEDAMVRIAIAPCSPFSVTRELMVEAAEYARNRDVRLHTHLAETIEEEHFCREQFGCRPVDYVEELGWLGDDVWLAHCIHLSDDEVRRFGETQTGVAHCPSSNARLGAGIAPVMDLVHAGAPVGLGVDGAASNESGELAMEIREAMLFARLRQGEAAMTARDALERATIDGARCLGRASELGSLEAGKLADIALWDISGVGHAGIADPIAALVFAAPRSVHTLLVNGRIVVRDHELRTGDAATIAFDLDRQARRLASKAVTA